MMRRSGGFVNGDSGYFGNAEHRVLSICVCHAAEIFCITTNAAQGIEFETQGDTV